MTQYLPDVLQEWRAQELQREVTKSEFILFVVLSLSLIAHLISTIGLFIEKKWAPRLFIATLVLLNILSLFCGPFVSHSAPTFFGYTSVLLAGIIAGLLLSDSIAKQGDG